MFTPLYCLSVTLLFHSLSVESPEAWRQISQSFVFFHLSIKVNSFPFWFIHVNACAPWFLLISLHASSIQMMKIGQIQGGGMSSMLTEPKLPVVKKRPRRGWGRLAGWRRLSESATGWEKEKSQEIHAVRGSHLRQRTNLVKIAVSGGVEIFYEIVIAVPFFISTCAEQIFTAKNSGSHKRVPGGLRALWIMSLCTGQEYIGM